MFSVVATLLGLSLFSSVTIQSSICRVPTTPSITSPESSITSTAETVVIEGSADNDTTVTLYNNGQTIGTITPDLTNSYEFQASLVPGTNSFGVRSSNTCGSRRGNTVTVTQPIDSQSITTPDSIPQTVISPIITFVRTVSSSISNLVDKDTTPSDIVLSGLKQTQVTSAPFVYISGRTAQPANVTLLVNGKPTALLDQIASSTAFGFSAPLSAGKNVISIVASTAAGKAIKVITVTRQVTQWYQSPNVQATVALSSVLILVIVGWIIIL